MNRSDILAAALSIIDGPRNEDYGPARENFRRIAVGVNLIATEALERHGQIGREHVALMMIWTKIARLLETPGHVDSWVDICGYAALGGELTARDEKVDGQDHT
jgi:hypothetical protein